jgi:hypothetical protein
MALGLAGLHEHPVFFRYIGESLEVDAIIEFQPAGGKPPVAAGGNPHHIAYGGMGT